jgi:hypothetical protein
VALKDVHSGISITGNSVKFGQLCQAPLTDKAFDMFNVGKSGSPGAEPSKVQPSHVLTKLVPSDVFILGNSVRLEQSRQALLKLVPEDVLIAGKAVRALQVCQA